MKEKNTWLFFFFIIFIFTIAFDSSRTIDKEILNNHDKIKHIAAFFVLGYFLYESSIKINNYLKFLILIFLAFSIEYIQSIIGREASIKDFLASSFGVFLFLFFRFIFKRFNPTK